MKTKNIYINTLEFAQKKQSIHGEVLVNDFPRLQEIAALSSENGVVRYQLNGRNGALGLPGIRLHIEVPELQVVCQRCLSEMPLALNLDFDYVVSKEPPDELDELDDADWLEAAQEFDLKALIEDELLLAMPIAPTHDFACNERTMQSGEKTNPFAVLKTLKTTK